MDSGITAKRAETSMQQQQLTPSLQKQTEILELLTKCSIRRGAPQNPAALAIYSQDLSSYGITEIREALEAIGAEAPEDFKAVWPAVGVFHSAIRARIRAKRKPEPTGTERWDAYADEFWKNPPAPLDSELQAKIDALNEKFGLKKEKEIDYTPVEMLCPHCSAALPVAPNIRFWSPDELRMQADALEEHHRIADANKEVA